MKIGFDWWQVLSHYPEVFKVMTKMYDQAYYEVHVISAIGKTRIGTIKDEVLEAGYGMSVHPNNIHEVVFKTSKDSPELKLAKCKELGITIFYDDRQDVCDLLNANGILAFKVPRKDETTDLEGERK